MVFKTFIFYLNYLYQSSSDLPYSQIGTMSIKHLSISSSQLLWIIIFITVYINLTTLVTPHKWNNIKFVFLYLDYFDCIVFSKIHMVKCGTVSLHFRPQWCTFVWTHNFVPVHSYQYTLGNFYYLAVENDAINIAGVLVKLSDAIFNLAVEGVVLHNQK